MKRFLLLILVAAGACTVPATPGGEVKKHNTQYGMIHRVSVDSAYGIVCYSASSDTIVYLDARNPISCVYSPEIRNKLNTP